MPEPACPGSTRKSSPVIRHFPGPRLFFITVANVPHAAACNEPIAGIVLDVIIESSEACACLCFLPLGADLRVRRGVAQPGRAPGSGPGGRRFKSSLPDQSFQALKLHFWFSVYMDGVEIVDGHIFLENSRKFHRIMEPLAGHTMP